MITYMAINTINGKFYIGSTTNFEERKKQHLSSKCEYPFQKDLRENPDSFIWEIHEDLSKGRELEQALLNRYAGLEQCYNLLPSAKGGWSHYSCVGNIWVNNGEKECLINPNKLPSLGEGWVRGRISPEESSCKLISESLRNWEGNPFRRRGGESMSHGRRWYCNPDKSKEIYLKPCEVPPEGWSPGRSKKKPRTEGSREKTRQSLKGKTKSPQHRDKLRQASMEFHKRKRQLEDQ